jgi:hypothetical protein
MLILVLEVMVGLAKEALHPSSPCHQKNKILLHLLPEIYAVEIKGKILRTIGESIHRVTKRYPTISIFIPDLL